jgi:predicted metal-binding integral membrane protein DUF2182
MAVLQASWWLSRWRVFAGPRTRLPTALLPPVAAAWWLMLQHALGHRHPVGLGHGAHPGMSLGAELAHWMLMVIAMMLPFLGPTLAEVRRTTYPAAHAQAVGGYLLGWLSPWLLLGAPVALFRGLEVAHAPGAAGVAFVVSAAWAFTGWHVRGLASCGLLRPLPPAGFALLGGATREGWHAGAACCTSCGPLMLACTLTGHSVVAMLGGFALGWLERSTYRPSIRVGAALALALGLWFFIFPGAEHAPGHHHHHVGNGAPRATRSA